MSDHCFFMDATELLSETVEMQSQSCLSHTQHWTGRIENCLLQLNHFGIHCDESVSMLTGKIKVSSIAAICFKEAFHFQNRVASKENLIVHHLDSCHAHTMPRPLNFLIFSFNCLFAVTCSCTMIPLMMTLELIASPFCS